MVCTMYRYDYKKTISLSEILVIMYDCKNKISEKKLKNCKNHEPHEL
jgi:hypothetical protein